MRLNHLIAPVIPAFAAVLLSGCASTQLRSDAATAAATGVPEPIESKIDRGRALTADEIVMLSQRGVPDEVILRNFEASLAVYQLQTTDVERLRSAGVNTSVIDAMLVSGARRAPQGYWGGTGYHHRGYHVNHSRHHYGGLRHHRHRSSGLRHHRGHHGGLRHHRHHRHSY